MRRLHWLLLPALAAGLAFAWPGPAAAATGGSPAPQLGAAPSKDSGGTAYSNQRDGARRRPARRRRPRGPVLASFTLERPRLFLYGSPARVRFRIRSRARLRAVRISITPLGARRPAASIGLGPRRAGREESVPVTGREAGVLPEGAYRLRISARDVRGRGLRRAAGISATSGLTVLHHAFPLGGAYAYGGADARFGAARGDRAHRGQDLIAPEGTPVLAPRGGTVKAVQYQAGGAGHYVVLDGAGEERDYVFMHLRAGSIAVREGEVVLTRQAIGEVGSTGRSSGPHLHFEIWDGAGWYGGGEPVDPLPLLQSWARASLTRIPA